MSSRVHPFKYFVPELTEQYVGNFGEHSNTIEARALRLLLETDSSSSSKAAIVVNGIGGSGKTTVLIAVGNQETGWARFSEAVWFIVLGQDAHPSTLLENLEEVIRSVVGEAKADEIRRLSTLQDKSSAVAEAIRVLKDHDVLLLLDDVWADEKERVVGQSTVFSLVRDCLRRVQRNPGRLRVVVSTRDAGVATLVKEGCRVNAEPFEAREATAREILCRYADISVEEIESRSSSVQESFNEVLDRCGGLSLALAVAGSVIRERTTFEHEDKDKVWGKYAAELEEMETFLKQREPESDRPGLYAMVESSLEGVGKYMRSAGFVFWDEVKAMFSLLGVLRRQEAVPLSVVECIWGLSEEEALRLCSALERMHLVSLAKEKGVQRMRVHDVILGFCKVVLSEKPGRKSLAHRGTIDRLAVSVLQRRRGARIEDGGAVWAAWWKLGEAFVDEWTRDYCLRNLARHMVECGEEYTQRLLCMISDYRWIEIHKNLSKQGNDMSGIVRDVETFVTGCGEGLDEEVRRGVELISDAARLSLPYVAENPQELAFQLQGRLAEHAGQNAVVDYFLWSLDRYATRPWLKAGKGVLTAAGGPIVLSALLPKQLWCVAVLPNGEDVVVGGADGYLAVFSIRYASVSYELRGHDGGVFCVAVGAARKRMFSGGKDGTVRAWELGTGQEAGEALVKHERSISSLAITADESRLVFGDTAGWLVVCDSTSGDVRFEWRGHSSRVRSLAVRAEDEMVVSGSYDGTIGRWESASGEEFGTRIPAGGGKVYGVAVSRDGKRIAFAASGKVGALDADSGNVLRECDTESWAFCADFGPDDEAVHFGRVDGTTAALAPDGDVVCDVKAHSLNVLGIAQSDSSQGLQLLVSVSEDRTLLIQNLERTYSSGTAPGLQYELLQFVVLPDRKRTLYSWGKGPRGLWLLNLDPTSPETALSTGELINVSTIIGSTDAYVSAIAVSRDGRYAVAGTSRGEITVYCTDTWRPRYASLRQLRGRVWSAAISNNCGFFAAGSSGGSVALFRLEDGGDMQLPSSAGLAGKVVKVAFSEEGSSLFAMVHNKSHAAGMLHVWKHIDQAAYIEHIGLPFNTISIWLQPDVELSAIASSSHIAIRDRADNRTCVYDFTGNGYNLVCAQEEDESGLLQVSNREHAVFKSARALFMAPFSRTIRCCHGADSEVLGTLEAAVCHSFHPEQWTFDGRTGLFVAGGLFSRIVSAVLMREEGKALTSRPGAPKLPLVHKVAVLRVGSSNAGAKPSHYTVFISHAGPDKHDIAIPLYRRLGEKGITAFVDKEELRPGDQAPKEMEMAMETADIGVFVTSPEFVCRWWPMKELSCFLGRTGEAEAKSRRPATVLPVFYRLGVHECRRSDLFNKSEMVEAAVREGFFSAERQEKMSIQKVLEHLKGLAGFTGIENGEGVVNDAKFRELRTKPRLGRIENRMARDRLLEQIVDAVVEVQGRKGLSGGESAGEGSTRKVGGENSGRDGAEVEAEAVRGETGGGDGALQLSLRRVGQETGSEEGENGRAGSGNRSGMSGHCCTVS